MCTPTATPPKWLMDEHPDIAPVDDQGRPRGFGSRRHYSFSSPVWIEESKRICEIVAKRYGKNPHVAGWQPTMNMAAIRPSCHGAHMI